MADIRTFTVIVTQRVEIKLDADKFDDAFMAEFRESFFPLFTLEDHAMHLAQLAAREVYSLNPHLPKEFVEGYGEIGPMGIAGRVVQGWEEIEGPSS